MKNFLPLFSIFLILLLLLFFSRSMRIPQVGEFLKQAIQNRDEKWRVVARVEIVNGEVINITNLYELEK